MCGNGKRVLMLQLRCNVCMSSPVKMLLMALAQLLIFAGSVNMQECKFNVVNYSSRVLMKYCHVISSCSVQPR